MRKTETKAIDGITLTVQQLPAMRALKLMHRLARSVGPAMLRALSGVDLGTAQASPGGLMSRVKLDDVATGLQSALAAFSEADLEALVKELFETTMVDRGGQTMPLLPVFDDVFQGAPLTILKAVRFALEVNFGNFFAAFQGASLAMRAPKSET